MTPHEIQAEARKLRDEIGEKASVYASINDYGAPLYLAIYPNGITENERLHLSASDWPELFAAGRDLWAKHKIDYRADLIRRMALAIIRATAEQGECSDAALRAQGFTASEVETCAAEACADADAIASNGPFTITRLAGANAA